ncbi:MAG: Ulp1 family isopeptidase [Chlamydiales bacterium]
MSIKIESHNTINASDAARMPQDNSTQSSVSFRIYELVSPIFKKIRDTAYFIVSQRGAFIQKAVEISNWALTSNPPTFIGTYLYRDTTLQKKLDRHETLDILKPPQSTAPDTLELEKADYSEEGEKDSTQMDLNFQNYKFDKRAENEFEESISKISSLQDKSLIASLAVETSPESPSNEEQRDSKIEDSFEIIQPLSPELVEEMQNVSYVTPGSMTRVEQIWKNIQTFNPFNSKTWGITTPSNTTPDLDPQDHFYKDLQIITPIIRDLRESRLPTQLPDIFANINIHWDPEFPEKTEIVCEEHFQLKRLQEEPNLVPNSIHLLRVKNFLDTEEITFTKVHQEENAGTEDDFELVNRLEVEKESISADDDFEIFDSNEITERSNENELDDDFESIGSFDEKDNTESNFDIALNNLLNNTNCPLLSGITSEYLNALKNKHPNFIYNDRLIYGNIPITTDKIIEFLSDLKNKHPSNQVIFLPFLVKGWTVDHAVVAVINLANETIEYFDPKRQSWFTTRTEKQSSKNVFDFLTEIGQKIISPTFSKEKVLYNAKNIPQGSFDNINCGAFCLQFIEERVNNNSFDAIEDDIINKLINPIEIRHQLANNLIQNTYSGLV